MASKHKGKRNAHWKPLTEQVEPVRRMLSAPMWAHWMPDWAVGALADHMGAEGSALLVVGLASAAGLVKGRKVPAHAAAAVREGWTGACRPRGGRHQR